MKINSQSIKEKLRQATVKKAKEVLTPEESEQIEIIYDGDKIDFKGPKEIVEKLVKGLKVNALIHLMHPKNLTATCSSDAKLKLYLQG